MLLKNEYKGQLNIIACLLSGGLDIVLLLHWLINIIKDNLIHLVWNERFEDLKYAKRLLIILKPIIQKLF